MKKSTKFLVGYIIYTIAFSSFFNTVMDYLDKRWTGGDIGTNTLGFLFVLIFSIVSVLFGVAFIEAKDA